MSRGRPTRARILLTIARMRNSFVEMSYTIFYQKEESVMFRYSPILLPLLLVLILISTSTRASEPVRPNIVFIFTDDQRNDTLGCAGHPIIQTPNIDRLAAEGVRFENAFVTTSICWVSRSTVLTGMWSRSHGAKQRIDNVSASAAETVYPLLLRAEGYRTGFFGKWHARMPKSFDNNRAFDVYEAISRDPYFKKQQDGSLRHETELIGDGAVEFISSQPSDKPFCVNLWFNAAHAEDGDKRPGEGHFPWSKGVDHMYRDCKIPPPRLSATEIYDSQPGFLKKSINRERFFWRWDTPEKYATNMRAYFRMLSGIDRVVGRVVKALEEHGLADNTVIVYSADNGYYMGDRGFAGKWSHYEQSIRVPMILYDPRLQPERRGRVLSEFVLNVDLPSTFLDLAGLQAPSQYQGQSLLPLVRNEAGPWREDVFLEHLLPMEEKIPKWEGVKNARYKYANYFEQDHEFLHDLESDPDELQNVSKIPEYSDVLNQLRQRTAELRAKYEAAGDGWRP